MTSAQFHIEPTADWTILRLLHEAQPLAPDDWALHAPDALLPGVDLAGQLEASDSALRDANALLIEHTAIAGLSAHQAALLGLPPLTMLHAAIDGAGLIGQPGFRATLQWQRATGQAVLSAERCGAWLRVGQQWQRLPTALFDIAEAIDRLSAAPGEDMAERLTAIAQLRDALLPAQQGGMATARGLLGRMAVTQADAFSIDVQGQGDAIRLVPVLHRVGSPDGELLLTPEQQRRFGEELFPAAPNARAVHSLGGGTYVVLAPPLRRALAEVQRMAHAPPATRRAFAAEPRAFLRQVLGDDADPTVIENLFVETPAWSERVIGLGLWEKRSLPWVQQPASDWFGADADSAGAGHAPAADPIATLGLAEVQDLQQRVEHAIAHGQDVVEAVIDGVSLALPPTHDTLARLQRAEAALLRAAAPASPPPAPAEVLLIKPNEETLEVEPDAAPRAAPEPGLPHALSSVPKPHQAEGIAWLQRAWTSGLPGVLLADDMGLGKTLQGLAFLAWLRGGMSAGRLAKAPVLIVAPTGLLENWREEHNRHLAQPGLGDCLPAYGSGLAILRRPLPDGRPGLDVARLAQADWVLTTYETLRDHDRDFGQVEFAAVLFDEAQKIKTPGVRITDAAKAVKAMFRVALTGTPVENRLSDLWCIVDTVSPGHLGELKRFSAVYERDADAAKMRQLRDILDRDRPGRPALLLRRLKEDRLPELPPRQEQVLSVTMQGTQLEAYRAAIADARDPDRRGAALEALQKLRALCLHPDPSMVCDDAGFIAASARLQGLFQALDSAAAAGERVLVFLDDLAMQARLSGVIQRRYRLASTPMIINGAVDGRNRQARVNRFQDLRQGFDVMLLSSRTGGVGLTLTNANHVVHLMRWWNPAVEDQCTGRVLRIGQERPVTVHIPMAMLPGERRSFDENLDALLKRKRQLMREALMPAKPSIAEQEDFVRRTLDEDALD